MTINLARCNAVRQIVKNAIDDLEADFPGVDVSALHATLAMADGQFHAVAERIGWEGPAPLDGDPKPGH